MSTGEGADARDERDHNGHDRRGERIGIGGGDDSVTRIQLAARWAESYGPATDSLGGILRRFRAAYDYLDAVTHGVEPPDLEDQVAATRTASQPVPQPTYAAPTPPQPPSQYAPPPSQYAPQPGGSYPAPPSGGYPGPQGPAQPAPPAPSPPTPPQPEPRPWS